MLDLGRIGSRVAPVGVAAFLAGQPVRVLAAPATHRPAQTSTVPQERT